MTHPNIPRTLGLETPPSAAPTIVSETPAIDIRNLSFEEPMLLMAGNHCIFLNAHNFFIQLLYLTADGNLVLDYNDNHYERVVPNSTIITLGDNTAHFEDFL